MLEHARTTPDGPLVLDEKLFPSDRCAEPILQPLAVALAEFAAVAEADLVGRSVAVFGKR